MEFVNTDEHRMWREYCAVVQLPQQQFLDIQETLLSEQLELVAKSEWYRPFLGDSLPKNVGEFRRIVPLHQWRDYAPVLQPESLNGYATDLHCWVQTTWSHGSWKQVPWVRRFFDAQCRHTIAAIMMSVARYEGDVRLNDNFHVLPILPETPFASAWLATGVVQRDVVSSRLAPQVDDSQLPMSQRVQTGLWRSLETGVDCVVGMTSTLLLARREFERMAANTSFRQLLSEVGTRAAFKWAFGKMRRLGRKQAWLPKSLLSPKAVITWGADTSILAPTLADHWGAPVFELYASSESGIIAMQDWRRDGLIPLPTSVFLEFLPAGEQPDHEATLLLNELEEGKVYEPIITSFYGMPFLRMRQGDLLQVVGRNEHRVPKFVFKSRADDIIDLGSIARIDRATLSEAMDMVGVKEGEWQARKEYLEGRPVMCLYIEPGPDDTKELSRKLHRALGKVDPHYREASYTLRYPLIRVSPASVEAVPTNGSSPS